MKNNHAIWRVSIYRDGDFSNPKVITSHTTHQGARLEVLEAMSRPTVCLVKAERISSVTGGVSRGKQPVSPSRTTKELVSS